MRVAGKNEKNINDSLYLTLPVSIDASVLINVQNFNEV